MATVLKPDDQMTIDEFLAYTSQRPDGERWELIEGVAYMNAAPTDVHQMIAANIARWLMFEKQRTRASWLAMPGIGTRVPISPRSLPQPDVFVRDGPLQGLPTTDDALVLFEIISKSNSKADQAWRRRVYASVPNCQHYVAVAQNKAMATRYDRNSGWLGVELDGIASTLALPLLGSSIALRLAEIYRWTPLGPSD